MEEGKLKEEMEVIPGPEMVRLGKLELPSPPEIHRGNFDHEALVQFPKISDLPKVETAFPQLLSLDERNVTPRYSVSDISRALKLSEAELYISIFKSEQKLRFSLFGRLDKLFHGNRKAGEKKPNNKRHE